MQKCDALIEFLNAAAQLCHNFLKSIDNPSLMVSSQSLSCSSVIIACIAYFCHLPLMGYSICHWFDVISNNSFMTYTAGVHFSFDVLPSWSDQGSCAHKCVCKISENRHEKCRKLPLNKHAMNIWLSSLRIRAHLSWRTGKHLHVLHVLRTYPTCSYPGYQDTTTYAALTSTCIFELKPSKNLIGKVTSALCRYVQGRCTD